MPDPQQPNVLVIHCDQLRYDGLGCTGDPANPTPNIDALADSGTLFRRHFVSNPICQPSRATLMTGLMPPGHNVWTNGVQLPRQDHAPRAGNWWHRQEPNLERGQATTMADGFALAGYRTGAFGKLHLQNFRGHTPDSPERYCSWPDHDEFDDWHGPYYGFQHVDLMVGHSAPQYAKMGHYSRWLREQAPELARRVPERAREGKLTDLLGDAFLSPIPHELHYTGWLADRFGQWLDQQDGPFCAFVGFPGPHHPFAPSEDVWDRFKDAPVREPVDFYGESLQQRPAFQRVVRFHDSLTLPSDRELARTVRRLTSAMVWQIDQAVGRILQKLEDAGVADETIVVFTSDHGDFLGDLGLLRKQTAADGRLLHVPFILRAPGQDLDHLSARPMDNADVLPTLAALAAVDLPEPVHGGDIRAKDDDRHAFSVAYQSHHVVDRTLDNYTCWDGRYRATWYPHRDEWELFDHEEDPHELQNLAQDRLEVVEQFRARIAAEHMTWSIPQYGRLDQW